MTPDQLSDRLLDFSVSIGIIVDALPDTKLGRHVSGQLVRCGTSPAPNYEEACAAESKADFVHKISISSKELRESRHWLKLINRAKLLQPEKVAPVLDECNQLCNIVAQSRLTAKGLARGAN